MGDYDIIKCPKCMANNRIPTNKKLMNIKCGNCGSYLKDDYQQQFDRRVDDSVNRMFKDTHKDDDDDLDIPIGFFRLLHLFIVDRESAKNKLSKDIKYLMKAFIIGLGLGTFYLPGWEFIGFITVFIILISVLRKKVSTKKILKWASIIILIYIGIFIFQWILNITFGERVGSDILFFIIYIALFTWLIPAIYKQIHLGQQFKRCRNCGKQNSVYTYKLKKNPKVYKLACKKCGENLDLSEFIKQIEESELKLKEARAAWQKSKQDFKEFKETFKKK